MNNSNYTVANLESLNKIKHRKYFYIFDIQDLLTVNELNSLCRDIFDIIFSREDINNYELIKDDKIGENIYKFRSFDDNKIYDLLEKYLKIRYQNTCYYLRNSKIKLMKECFEIV